jgi:hypothetical protein
MKSNTNKISNQHDVGRALDHPLTDRHQIWNVEAFAGMYIRINKVEEGYLKKLSVREIDPLP